MDPAPNLEPIPRPPGHMLAGNLFDLEAGHPIESLMELARKYGPIFELDLPGGRSLTIVSSFDLVDELCNDRVSTRKWEPDSVNWPRVPLGAVCSPPRRRTRSGARRTMCFCPPSAWTQCAATFRACSISRAN